MKMIGRITLDLSPQPGNPRNSEGAFHTLDDGRILYAYSKYIGDSASDDGYSCIACRTSDDGAETWSCDRVLFRTEDHGARNVMSVSFLDMENVDIGLFYLVRQGLHDTRLHLRRSDDGAATWSEAVACIPAPGYYVTNCDRVIRLSTGRILVPANLHRMRSSDTLDLKSFDRRGIPCVFFSDDDGFTWQEGRGYCAVTLPHSRTGLQESGVIELDGGTVWQWMRTDMGRQYEAFSTDGGDTWTAPQPSRFTSPASPLSMKRIPADGRLLAVWNPIPDYNGRPLDKAIRTPLVLATSPDNGRTWTEPVVIEDDPDYGYCYVSIHFVGDSVLLAYCAGGPIHGSCLARTVVRKVKLAELPG